MLSDIYLNFDMKSSHINLLLFSAFLIFATLYWIIQSSSTPQPDTPRPVSSSVQQLPDISSTESITIDALKQRVIHTPNDSTLLNHLAQVLHDEGRYEEAITYYNRFLTLAPQNVQGWLDLANVYAALEKWDKALEASQSLLNFIPYHPSAMYNMGAIHANLANFDQAIYWWSQVQDQQEDAELAIKASQGLRQIQSSSSL